LFGNTPSSARAPAFNTSPLARQTTIFSQRFMISQYTVGFKKFKHQPPVKVAKGASQFLRGYRDVESLYI
jgi:hypothetical protein